MDIVTVTYSSEKELMRLQAHSLDLFVKRPCTHWVLIEDNKMPMAEWYALLKPFYKRHKLNLIDTSNWQECGGGEPPYYFAGDRGHGYLRQQVIKFYIATLIDSEYYLILDSKNFFIKATDLHVLIPYNHGNIIQTDYKTSIEPHWGKFISDAMNTYPQLKMPDKFWHPITPFKCNTALVNQLVQDVDLNKLFTNWHLKELGTHKHTPLGAKPSEFVLYQLYLNSQEDNLDIEPIIKVFWQENDLPNIEELNNYLEAPRLYMLGIHSSILGSTDKLKILGNWLISIGFGKLIIEQVLFKQVDI